MTTRKRLVRPFLAAALAGLVMGGTGCATSGPLHVYSLPAANSDQIGDRGNDGARAVPSFLQEEETIVGFAYDPFTDHFFLRLAPGNAIKVVDRPARAIKREFKLAQLGFAGGGDLAIRPRDGHVFAALPDESSLVEFTRYGDYTGTIALEGLAGAVRGVAFDTAQDRLLVLSGESPAQISVHATDGRQISLLHLDRAILPGCLAFDSSEREFYLPLANGAALGVFGDDGKFRRELPLRTRFFDVGPHSFLRMF